MTRLSQYARQLDQVTSVWPVEVDPVYAAIDARIRFYGERVAAAAAIPAPISTPDGLVFADDPAHPAYRLQFSPPLVSTGGNTGGENVDRSAARANSFIEILDKGGRLVDRAAVIDSTNEPRPSPKSIACRSEVASK